jgi:hypothetical protein
MHTCGRLALLVSLALAPMVASYTLSGRSASPTPSSSPLPPATTLNGIPAGSVWRYLDTGASLDGITWKTSGYLTSLGSAEVCTRRGVGSEGAMGGGRGVQLRLRLCLAPWCVGWAVSLASCVMC